MKKGFIVCSIVASSLILAGILLFVGVMAFMRWDFWKLSTEKYETNTTQISESFDGITVVTNTADVAFLPSEDGSCRVVCYEAEKMKHAVSVTEKTLEIKVEDTRRWYDYISVFSFKNPMITVYLPQGEYGDLSVKISTGDVEIPSGFSFETAEITGTTGDVSFFASVKESADIKTSTGGILVKDLAAGSMSLTVSTGCVEVSDLRCAGELSLRVSTGTARLSDVSCGSFSSTGDTGDLKLFRVIADKTFSIERDTGDVEFESCDASEIFIKTDTGEIEGSLLTEKIFFVETSTGDVDVPRSMSGGRCEITTSTGDVEITAG